MDTFREALDWGARALSDHPRGIYVFLIVFATLAVRYLVRLLLDRVAVHLGRTHTLHDDALLSAARRPLGWGIWTFGILAAAEVAGRDSGAEIFAYIDPVRDVALMALIGWFALRYISFYEAHVADPEYGGARVDRATATAVGKLLRASVAITVFLMALQSLGFSVTGVLAFGGIGGIAVGFAARDLLANFFGALMIFLDRPFAVGDWIRSPDRDIEGTVEEIGWRQTRIRTFDQRPLYVPNSVFASLTVENPSRMFNRRIYEIIGVRYDDMAAVREIVADIRAMLEAHEAIDLDRTLIVNLLGFGASSVDIMVYTFTRTTNWVEFHGIKEDVLLRIADVVDGHGAEIAFPTTTVHLASAPRAEPDPGAGGDGAGA